MKNCSEEELKTDLEEFNKKLKLLEALEKINSSYLNQENPYKMKEIISSKQR